MKMQMQMLMLQLFWQVQILEEETNQWYAWSDSWQYGDYDHGNKRAAHHAARNISSKYGWKTRVQRVKVS